MPATILTMGNTQKNMSIWSLMISEERDKNRHKKISRFCKACIVLACILLIGALFIASFVLQWYNAQKLDKRVSNELLEMRAENMGTIEEEMDVYLSENNGMEIAKIIDELNGTITKNEKMNNKVWEEISKLRAEIEVLKKNVSFASNETDIEKLAAQIVKAFSTNAIFLEDIFVLQSNAITAQIGAMMIEWQNKTVDIEAMHKNISKLVLARFRKLEKECAAELLLHKICPINKMDARNRWDYEHGRKYVSFSTDYLLLWKSHAIHKYTNIRAEQPISFNFSASHSNGGQCCHRYFYYEVLVNGMGYTPHEKGLFIGLIGPDFDVNNGSRIFVYDPSSYGIGSYGSFMQEGRRVMRGEGFDTGDTIGCGLIRLPNGQFKLFYTKNGQLNGRASVLLPSELNNTLYPIVMLEHQGIMVTANFGADLDMQPFKFNITEQREYLFEVQSNDYRKQEYRDIEE